MRVLVLGSGLAGTLVAEALIEQGLDPAELTVLDEDQPRSRDSAWLGAILHPFPGRRVGAEELHLDAFLAAHRCLRRWRRECPDDVILEAPMLRPLSSDSPTALRLRQSYDETKSRLPDLIEHELLPDAAAVRDVCPLLDTERFRAALFYRPAYSVDLAAVLRWRHERLRGEGVVWRRGRAVAIAPQEERWEVRLAEEQLLSARHLILCCGAGLTEVLPSLPLRVNHGELLWLEPTPEIPPLEVLISGGGHLAPRLGGGWVVGSSYLRTGEIEGRSEEEAKQALLARAARLVPAAAVGTVREVWRGRRTIYGPDRQPLAGPVPGQAGLWVVGGLGSKGLFWAPSLAAAVAREIRAPGTRAVPQALRAERASPHAWRIGDPLR